MLVVRHFLDVYKYSIFPHTASLWIKLHEKINKLHEKIKESQSLDIFLSLEIHANIHSSHTASLWNKLHETIKETQSLDIFKSRI